MAITPRRVVGFLFGLRKISPKLTALMVITQGLFAVLTTTIAPLFVSQLLFHIANGSATLTTSIWLLIGYALVLLVGEVVLVRLTILLSFIVERKMQISVDQRVFDYMTTKSLTYHSNRMSGGIVSDKTKLFGSVERFWDTVTFNITPIVVAVLSVCIALIFIFWQFAIVLGILSIVIATIIIRVQMRTAPISQRVAEKGSRATAYFADVIANISSVKAFAGEASESKAYSKLLDAWGEESLIEMKAVVLRTGSFGLLMVTLNILSFVMAIIITQNHLASIGVVYLVINYTLNIVGQLWTVSNITRAYNRIIGDAGPMIDEISEPIDLLDPSAPRPLIVSDGKIEFKNVTFTHDENDESLFHNFSLTINTGEKIGLVGESGSGKTSLTRLLLRFSDVDSGSIEIDGQPINTVTQADVHRAIAYVAQEPALFHRSLSDNISYGRPNATTEEIHHAASLAHATEFIDHLPKGYDTLVGERGIKLSGGQRQRVAIARAILKDAPILVLDEATSALDSHSEKLIQDALSDLMKNRTSIVIAHRLSTIAKLDRIVVLDHGRIAEDGTHAELLKQNGIYAKLWAHQSGGFIEE